MRSRAATEVRIKKWLTLLNFQDNSISLKKKYAKTSTKGREIAKWKAGHHFISYGLGVGSPFYSSSNDITYRLYVTDIIYVLLRLHEVVLF